MIHNWKEGYGDCALVTGASSGIGKEFCYQLANRGMNIVLVARRKNLIEEIALDIELKNGVKTKIIDVDITQDFAVDQIYDKLKNIEVGFLVNNAGINMDNLSLRMKEEEWKKVIDINLGSTFLLCKYAIKKMLKNKYGRIVNITSVVGHTGNIGQSNYAASKAGIIGMTKSLAIEYAKKNITLNCVSPGFIQTTMTDNIIESIKSALTSRIPMSRLGTAEDVANTVAFLSSDLASYITGETVHVNGGMYMA